jgi:hypothetical protein
VGTGDCMRGKHDTEATYLHALCFGDGDICAMSVASIKDNCVCFVYLSPRRTVQIEFDIFQE